LADHLLLNPRTKHLSIKLLDKTISELIIEISELQLLACLCLSLAQKFEETKNFLYSDIEKLTHYQYTEEQISQFELKILKGFHWKFNYPLAYDFLSIFSDCLIENNEEIQLELAQRMEFCLLEQVLMRQKPSILAMACLLDFFIDCQFQEGSDAALIFINQWGDEMKYEEIKTCSELLHGFFETKEPEIVEFEEVMNISVFSTEEKKYGKFEEFG